MQGNRKLLFAIAGLIILVLLTRIAELGDDAISSMFWSIMIMFGGGNVGEHFAKRGGNNVNPNSIR